MTRADATAGSDGTTEPDAAAWSARYESQDTPWDLGAASPLLLDALAMDPGMGRDVGRALVPGCGRAHDAAALARAGWDVVAVDMAPSVAATARAALEPHGGRFVLGDALTPDATVKSEGPFDLLFDHTFFCALPLRLRPRFGSLCREAVAEQGRVISIVFPIGRSADEGGPPFAMSPDDVSDAIGPGFERTALGDPIAVPGRGWDHCWGVWERRDRDR